VIEESPIVACTLYTEDGQVDGAYLSNGEVVNARPAPATAQSWDEQTAEMVTYEVVWSGAHKRTSWSHTRGELLGDYSRVPARHLKEVGHSLRVKVATWAKRRIMEKEEGS
jgi:hypothetical protein